MNGRVSTLKSPYLWTLRLRNKSDQTMDEKTFIEEERMYASLPAVMISVMLLHRETSREEKQWPSRGKIKTKKRTSHTLLQ